jgi:hypothetical protein
MVTIVANSSAVFALDEFEYRDDYSPWMARVRIGMAIPDYAATYDPANTDDGGTEFLSSSILFDTDLSYQITPKSRISEPTRNGINGPCSNAA